MDFLLFSWQEELGRTVSAHSNTNLSSTKKITFFISFTRLKKHRANSQLQNMTNIVGPQPLSLATCEVFLNEIFNKKYISMNFSPINMVHKINTKKLSLTTELMSVANMLALAITLHF